MIAADNKILTQTAMAEAARPLPAWTYSNAELQPLEYQRLILESWQIVCHVNQVKQPGDYATLDLLSDSIFVMRGDDGEVRAFQNVCRHRGARLLDGAGTCARRLVCPYHGWTYDNTGRLAAVPAEGTFPGIDRSRLGLRQVRHEVFMGFVFVRVVGDGPGVAEMWGDFARHLEPYGFERMEPLSKLWTAVWNADWKVAVDNNLENYHIPLGHPGYQRMLRNQLESEINPHGVARSVSVLRDRPSPNWVERMYQKLAPSVFDNLGKELRRTWQFYSMPPNLGVDVYPDSMDFFQVLPLGPGKCLVRSAIYGLPDERREMRILRYLNLRINRQVAAEDARLSTRVQAGLMSHGYEPGPLSDYEDALHQFHELVRARLPVTRLAAAPRPGTLVALDESLRAEARAEHGPRL